MNNKRGSVIPAGVLAQVTVVDGPDRGRRKTMRSRRMVIGRKSGDLVLRDSKVSSTHAALEYVRGDFMLYDLSSTNGTFVNDDRVAEKKLVNLDEVRLGFTTLLFQVNYKKKPQHPKDKVVPAKEDIIDSGETEIDSEEYVSSIDQNPVAIPEAKQIYLTVFITAGPHRKQTLKSNKESIVVGRVNSDILLKEDKDVSRKHALIEVVSGDQVFIRDLASTNGTFVNKKRIANCRLNKGDVIRVGQSEFSVRVEVLPR